MSHIKSVLPVIGRLTNRPFRVSIEGNIGSGKSTCINFFKEYDNVETHSEPLHEWRNLSGNNLLGLMYSDIDKWSFSFQHYVHLTRLKIQTSPPTNDNITVKIFERSIQNSRYCFVENARRQGYLQDPEFHVLERWFEYTEKHLDVSLDLIVYLRTTPEVVMDRVMRRGRAEEAEVPLDYLRQVHESYEQWLGKPSTDELGCEVLTIDADRNLAEVQEDFRRYSYKILGGNHTN